MARQVIMVTTNQDTYEVNQLLKNHFDANGFALKKYRDELTLSREDRYGRRFFKVYNKPGTLKIEAWVKNGNSELAIDDKVFGAMAKRGLYKDVEGLMEVFSGMPCQAYNSDTLEGSLDNEGYIVQTYDLNSDFKQYALLSIGLGVACFFLPLPVILILIASVGGVIYGIKGLHSSIKWVSLIGMALSAVDLSLHIINLIKGVV